MKSMQIWSTVVASLLVSNAVANTVVASNLRRRDTLKVPAEENGNSEIHHVLCRVTTFHQLYEMNSDSNNNVQSHSETHCIPIIDQTYEDDNSFPIQLPEKMMADHQAEIARGQLLVSISDAVFINNKLLIGEHAQYTVISEDPKYRHLLERHMQTANQVSVAVIRITTPSESPPVSTSTLSSTLFGGSGFTKQYSDCSFGKLQLVNNGVFDVKISKTTAQLGGDWRQVLEEAQNQIRIDRGLTSVQQLADKILMCLPPGTGDWAASAGVNSWRAQFNSQWCTSLSATMHEVGHLFGLLHAQKDYKEYADYSGYMSASYKDAAWPKKCFNGQNHDHFGWYSDKQLKMDPSNGGKVVQLAAFVDYPKAADAYVNIAISDKYFLQYNVADGFNVNTQDKANQVTLVEKYVDGSNLMTGLSPGDEWKISNFNGSGKTLLIRACGSGTGTSGAKAMLMSINFDTSLCDTYQGQSRFEVPSGGGGGCFSGENEIEILGKGTVKMETLKIGDYVRTARGQFSQVYSFGHLHKEVETNFLQIISEHDRENPLEITFDHMVFVESGDVVRASEVKVGDQLLGRNYKVAEIRSVKRHGVYAPVTFTGDIIVSGVVASSYVSIWENISPRIVNTASHTLMGLHRMTCKLDFEQCQSESYTVDGINTWIATAVQFVMDLQQQSLFIQIAAWILAIPFFVAIHVLERLLSLPQTLSLPMALLAVGYQKHKAVRLVKKC